MLDSHPTWIFDCDGVLLDSNWVKTEAFRRVALPYGDAASAALVAHHTAHGGISRFEKIAHLHTTILDGSEADGAIDEDVQRYGVIVRELFATVAPTDGARALLEALAARNQRCLVVSGGLETEVRDVLDAQGFGGFFDQVHGSPRSKHEIFATLAGDGTLDDAVYLGDSRYDHEVARDFGVPFVFVSGWTELADWSTYVEAHAIPHVARLDELVPATPRPDFADPVLER